MFQVFSFIVINHQNVQTQNRVDQPSLSLKARIEFLFLMFEKILCCYFMVDSTGLITLAIWPVCELTVCKSSKHSKPYLKHRLQFGENLSVSHFQFLWYFQICVMRYYSASTGSPFLHWVQTIFSSKLLTKVYISENRHSIDSVSEIVNIDYTGCQK